MPYVKFVEKPYVRHIQDGETCGSETLLNMACATGGNNQFDPEKQKVKSLQVKILHDLCQIDIELLGIDDVRNNKNVSWQIFPSQIMTIKKPPPKRKNKETYVKINSSRIKNRKTRTMDHLINAYGDHHLINFGPMTVKSICYASLKSYEIRSHCLDQFTACKMIVDSLCRISTPDSFKVGAYADGDITGCLPDEVYNGVKYFDLYSCRTISHDEFEFLIKNARPRERLTLDFTFSNQNFGRDLTVDDLCQLKCKEIVLRNLNLNTAAINGYIRHWLAGNNSQLQVLKYQGHFSLDDLSPNIKAKTFQEFFPNDQLKDKVLYFDIMLRVDPLNAKYVEREDGTIATFAIGEGPCRSRYFVFIVWNDNIIDITDVPSPRNNLNRSPNSA